MLYDKSGRSERTIAEAIGVPRSTLRYWLERKQAIDAAPELVAFFESEVGIAFLHRLILAAHFVITLLGPSGVRMVCLFLELAGLDQFVAASYGAQRQVNQEMDEAIVTYREEEQTRLSATMKPKQITLCEDETFHPETCLVAIEPVSNFIVVETYTSDRKAETWTAALGEHLRDLRVEVIQATSDEGRGICCHVKQDLGAHHSPDLFHVQQAATQATSAPLAAQVRKAEKTLEEARQAVAHQQGHKDAYMNSAPKPVGRPPDFDTRRARAQRAEQEAQAVLEAALARQAHAKAAIQGISQNYHPYDLQTGAAKDAETVATALAAHFTTLERVATAANLAIRCHQGIQKAKRVVAEMVATIAFFCLTIQAKVEALCLTPEQEQAVYNHLIPAIYLQRVADKAATAEERQALRQRSQRLLEPLHTRGSPLFMLDREEKQLIESVAAECVQLFQRSSSCTEGRNGQLALHHHGLHRISHRKLRALTTVHNYFLRRPDGSTAAQRFFEADHRNLFDYVLERVDLPGRPAQKRPPPQPQSSLI